MKMDTTKILYAIGTTAVAVVIATIIMNKFPQLSGNNFEGDYELV